MLYNKKTLKYTLSISKLLARLYVVKVVYASCVTVILMFNRLFVVVVLLYNQSVYSYLNLSLSNTRFDCTTEHGGFAVHLTHTLQNRGTSCTALHV